MASRFMSLGEMMGSVRCNSGRQRALITFERFVGARVRKPMPDETCACPLELCKFQQIINSGGFASRLQTRDNLASFGYRLRESEHVANRQLEGRR